MQDISRDFLGAGWKFPVRVNTAGKIVLSRHEEDIREAIWLILSTAKGERVMRPDFGCGIHDLVFAPINASTLNLVETTVREALIFYEPRIDVLNVSVSDEEAHVGKLIIEIDYRVRATNNEFNLVFPFYLKEGGG
jgi:phage baseplate assembly protein W